MTTKLIAGIAALGFVLSAGTSHAGGARQASKESITQVEQVAQIKARTPRVKIKDKVKQTKLVVDEKLANGDEVLIKDQKYVSKLIEETPHLKVLRTLSLETLNILVKIPQESVVMCGAVCPREHVIAGYIQDTVLREQVRTWIRGGGNWKHAIEEVLHEKEGA
jgi:hypothetical protein